MLQLLICLAAVAADAPPDVYEVPAPEEVPEPIVPTDSVSAYAHQAVQPALAGATSKLNLEQLGRTVTTFTLTLDASVLATADEGTAWGLQQHLQADPRWRVMEWDGVRMAVERYETGTERAVLWSGFRVQPRKKALRVALRFAPWPKDSPWGSSTLVSRNDASKPSMRITTFLLQQPEFAGWTTTALEIDGPHLSLDIYESTPGEDRDETIEALTSKLPMVESLLQDSLRAAERGYVPWQLPNGEPLQTGPPVEVQAVEQGMLEVRARVNPGQPGWCWARFLDTALVPYEEVAVAAGTRERVGWSADPTQRFYMQSTFPVPRGDAFSGTVEIWFQPDAPVRPRRLDAMPVTVPKR